MNEWPLSKFSCELLHHHRWKGIITSKLEQPCLDANPSLFLTDCVISGRLILLPEPLIHHLESRDNKRTYFHTRIFFFYHFRRIKRIIFIVICSAQFSEDSSFSTNVSYLLSLSPLVVTVLWCSVLVRPPWRVVSPLGVTLSKTQWQLSWLRKSHRNFPISKCWGVFHKYCSDNE